MKTLIIILAAAFLISSNLLSQDLAINSSSDNASVYMKTSKITSKRNAVMMQKMTTLERTEKWNQLFNNPPRKGFIVFDTDENDYFFFSGKKWETVIDARSECNEETNRKKMATTE
ncbi:MAG: hypothetical protein JXR51_12040 [Bacteroidales bacterium]|nr:hypothetical protein [Bacteroidales bacterium]MBN2757900.1 hypothetical protein [Bacteroidales bacterium]